MSGAVVDVDDTDTDSGGDAGAVLADLLCLPAAGLPVESRRGYLSERVVKGAAAFVDSSGLVEQWQAWWRADHPDWATRGGRPATVDARTVLTVFIALVAAGEPPQMTRVAEAIHLRLNTACRDLLGLPRGRGHVTADAFYHRVYRRLRWLLNVIDPYPGHSRRRITRAEHDAWRAGLDRDLVVERLRRVGHVTEALLEASLDAVPAEARRRWNGNICIDATVVRTWGQRGHPAASGRRDGRDDSMSPEALAGWYVRKAPAKADQEFRFGYEAHLAVMAASNPGEPAEFPLLVVAMSLDTPGRRVAENALTVLESIRRRGHPAGILAADRAYFPSPRPAKLQLPARALGYRLCGDYRIDQLGVQAEYGGALLVEGSWYCPSMPRTLIEASIDYRAGRIDADTYFARIDQRARYQFRPKHAPTGDGNTAYMCPARGPGATATCPLADGGPVGLGVPTVRGTRTRILYPPDDPGVACTNSTSVTIPLAPTDPGSAAIAKCAQDIPYKSTQWRAVYPTLRNTVEGFNGLAKQVTEEALELGERRRVRGYAFQAFAVALLILAVNLRKIRTWLDSLAKTGAGVPAAPPRRGRRRNARPTLADYLRPPGAPPLVQPA